MEVRHRLLGLNAATGHYRIMRGDFTPTVYGRITDSWLELTVRFITRDHGVRNIKDAMSREILVGLDGAGIGIASATFEITTVPLRPASVRIARRQFEAQRC